MSECKRGGPITKTTLLGFTRTGGLFNVTIEPGQLDDGGDLAVLIARMRTAEISTALHVLPQGADLPMADRAARDILIPSAVIKIMYQSAVLQSGNMPYMN